MSSQRLTVADLKEHVGTLGFCFPADDARFLLKLNEAEERMQVYGRWWGSIMELQACSRDCVITWPREVDTIEALSFADCGGGPVIINNPWVVYNRTYATLGSCGWAGGCTGGVPILGWGEGPCGPSSMDMLARQPCSFDVTAAGHKIKFYPTNSADVGKTIVVQGRDSSGVWVRTNDNGTVIDGEKVVLALPYVSTATVWAAGQPAAIQKQVTNYRVLMYDLDLATMQERPLGAYQAGETNPVYRTSKLPALAQARSSGSCCTYSTIRALVKLAHVPLRGNDDWLLYRNISAYKEAIMAILRWEEGNLSGGNFHFFGAAAPKQARMSNQATLSKGGAIPMLRAELRSMTADNTDVEVHYEYDDRLQWELAGFR